LTPARRGQASLVDVKPALARASSLERGFSARTQVIIAALCGLVAGVVVSALGQPQFAVLVGWDVAAVAYVVQVWPRLATMDPQQTSRFAVRADPTRATSDLMLLAAAVASLVAVGVLLVSAAKTKGGAQDVRVALALVSVVVSWSVVHTVYALRYAALYYTGPDGGVSFNEDEPPDYRDFVYLSLTIGMTFQVSDTDIQSKAIRRTAVRHALLSYLFGTGVVATTVNLVASLTTK
jgi:uncharacterized membrane protein